jgi:hypothetical protein
MAVLSPLPEGRKPRILLVWDYTRPDLRVPFERLAGPIDFSFLYFKLPNPERDGALPFPVYTWGTYNSPQALLRATKPDKVVFGDIETFYEVGLCVAARRMRIPTYLLAHGQRGGYEIDDAIARQALGAYAGSELKEMEIVGRGAPPKLGKSHTIGFYLRGLGAALLKNPWRWLRFTRSRSANDIAIALYFNQFEARRPDYLIDFTEENATYFQRRDGIPPDRTKLIGNPNLDDYFTAEKPAPVLPFAYALLIDTLLTAALIDAPPASEQIPFWAKLNDACLARGLRLVVKLHPRTPANLPLLAHDNITYLRQADLPALIAHASLGLAVISTLQPVLAYYCPTTVFYYRNDPYQAKLIATGSVQALPYLSFSPADIQPNASHVAQAHTPDFISSFFLHADGQATARLGTILRDA